LVDRCAPSANHVTVIYTLGIIALCVAQAWTGLAVVRVAGAAAFSSS